MPYRKSILLMIFSLTATAALTQTLAVKETEQRLTGNGSRTWKFQKFETYLGSGDKCTGNGELWTFKKDKTLVIDACVSGKIQHNHHTWKVQKYDELDVELVLDNKPQATRNRRIPMTLLLPEDKKKPKQRMILRVLSPLKEEATESKIFTYNRD